MDAVKKKRKIIWKYFKQIFAGLNAFANENIQVIVKKNFCGLRV